MQQKENMRLSNIVGLVGLILGTFIGAGFVGGREVAQYFSKYGFVAISMVILGFFMFYIFIRYSLLIGKKYNNVDNSINNVIKKGDWAVNVLIVLASLINVGAMIAGAYSIGAMFNIDCLKFLLPIVLLIFCFLVVKKRISGLERVNMILVPILLIAILIIAITTCFTSSNVTVLDMSIYEMIFGSIGSVLIYVLFNMFLLSVLLIQIGNNYTMKEIKVGSFVSSLIISILILLITLSITLSDKGVILSAIPLLQECINIDYNFAFVFAICQFFGIFTTIISSCYLTSNIMEKKIKSFNMSIIFTLILGIIISIIGFERIVKYLYALSGIMSIVFFAIMYWNVLGNKKDL